MLSSKIMYISGEWEYKNNSKELELEKHEEEKLLDTKQELEKRTQ